MKALLVVVSYLKTFALIFLVSGTALIAQEIRFEHISKNAGFSTGHILKLFQDQDGFIWIGTTDGLLRYDGRGLREFRHDPYDTTSISSNYIRCFDQDQEGRIWIGTANGLNVFDPEKETFRRYQDPRLEGGHVHSVLVDRDGFVWYGSYSGLFRLDFRQGVTQHFLPNEEIESTLTDRLVWKVFEDSRGNLWFGTGNGLTTYTNDGSFKFQRYYPNPTAPYGLQSDRVWEFAEQKDGTIWLGTANGLHRVHRSGEDVSFEHLGHEPANSQSLSGPFVESIAVDHQDRIWVATYNTGLNLVSTGANNSELEVMRFRHSAADPSSIGIDKVESVLVDKDGTVWIGSGAGLERVAGTSQFSTIRQTLDGTTIPDNIIKAVQRDSRGNLWIGTRNGLSVARKDSTTDNFTFATFKSDTADPDALSHNNVFGLYEDSLGYMWIGTYSGLNYVPVDQIFETPVFKYFTRYDGLPHNYTYAVHEIKKGVYWVPTYGQLSKMTFDPRTDRPPVFENFDMDPEREDALINALTYHVQQDRFGTFWISTFGGLSRYVNNNGREYFENYLHVPGDTTSIPSNSLTATFLDGQGRLWCATRGGLSLAIQDSARHPVTFRSFTSRHGLPNEVIQSIEEDIEGNLWVGTNKGLVYLDPNLLIANKPAIKKIFTTDDGLAGTSQIFRASHRDKNGMLYFGTAGGLTYFHPDQLQYNPVSPKLAFTELKVLNAKVIPSSEKNAILSKSINHTEEITLSHLQNIFSIEFVGLEFTRPEKNQYAHKLVGFNEDWVYTGTDNTATYTNLSPDTYTFMAKAANNDGIWNENAISITIKVLPPPWRTWWAYVFYCLIAGMALYTFMRSRIQKRVRIVEQAARIERARFEEREELRKKNAADFHDELGHRMTKISLFLELAERVSQNGGAQAEYLSKIKTNAAALSEGFRDLIWSLDPSQDTFYQTMTRLQEFGDKLFDHSQIKFKTEGIDQKLMAISLQADARKHLLLLFKEAMHNSLKYSGAENALFRSHINNGSVELTFRDDGQGFSDKSVKNGYGLKNMRQRAEKIGAHLDIVSSPGEGTAILVVMKIPQMGEGALS